MTKKNSMYINDYEVLGYYTENTTEESKEEYLNYLQSLIDYLVELKEYAEESDTKARINVFKECQLKLITFRNMLNAEKLSAWHTNVTYELQKEVEKLREQTKNINN